MGTKIILSIAGMIGIAVGSGLLFFPVSFEASAGIVLHKDVNLLSDIRAMGGNVLISGILIFSGVLKKNLEAYSLFLAVVIYLSYGFSRVYAICVDGLPNQSFVVVTISEIVIGSFAAVAFYQFRRK